MHVKDTTVKIILTSKVFKFYLKRSSQFEEKMAACICLPNEVRYELFITQGCHITLRYK